MEMCENKASMRLRDILPSVMAPVVLLVTEKYRQRWKKCISSQTWCVKATCGVELYMKLKGSSVVDGESILDLNPKISVEAGGDHVKIDVSVPYPDEWDK